MAAVSQHAMRRHPGGPLDASASLGPSYYAVSHQQSLSADKSKKSWSQRLKITKTEKQLAHEEPDHHHHHHNHHQQQQQMLSPSALARSMKYAEPWYYGTLRGVPVAMPGHQMFPPMREIAVVICSCPEYLNGTKKDTKKTTICKKCRGSRLPIAPIGGTVRLRSTTPMVHAARGSAGTVRLPSAYNFKQRPSILSAESDPYDMMRRSRLVSPELQPVNNVLKTTTLSAKNRAKSSSPSRSRSRTRKRTPSPTRRYAAADNRSRSASRSNSWLKEADIDAATAAAASRRSILHCDLSAYELISKISHNNEFSPMSDDDMYSMHCQRYENYLSPTSQHSSDSSSEISAIGGGQRLVSSGSVQFSPKLDDSSDTYVYEKLCYPVSDHSDTASQKSSSSVSARRQNGVVSPVRPPRSTRQHGTGETNVEIESPAIATSPKSEFVLTHASLSHISSEMAAAHQQVHTIKSILKRPLSSSSLLLSSPTPPLSPPSSSSSSSSSCISNIESSPTSTDEYDASMYHKKLPKTLAVTDTNGTAKGKVSISLGGNTTAAKITTPHNNHNIAGGDKEKRNSGSHFYLPMPQRKKVQFLVENEIIYDNQMPPSQQQNTDVQAVYCSTDDYAHAEQRPNVAFGGHHDDYRRTITTATPPRVDVISVDDNMWPKPTMIVANETNSQNSGSDTNGVGQESATTTIGCETLSASSSESSGKASKTTTHTLNNNEKINSNGTAITHTTAATKAQTDEDNDLHMRSRTILRRSFSDRRLSDATDPQMLHTKVIFNDTTALRTKPNRNDTRNLFTENLPTPNRSRPRDPPPPPPPLLSAKEQHKHQLTKKRQPTRPPRQSARKLSTTVNTDVTVIVNSIATNDYEDYSFTSSSPTAISDNVKLIVCNTAPSTNGHVHNVSDDDNNEQRKRIQANNEAFQGSRLFGVHSGSKKTVVKVAPLIVCRESSEIHRLEIKNEDDEYEPSKKTSILISGDDCYSTINVNDNQPMYHASVVVNSGDISPSIVKTNYNTVSINVTTPQTTEEQLVVHNNEINSLLNCSIIPIEDCSSVRPIVDVSPYSSQTRTLITVDYNATSHIETKEVISNDEELLLMLRNPVEAVKRNLVPHVCGKNYPGAVEVLPKKSAETRKVSVAEKLHCASDSFIGKLLEDPTLGHLAEGLDNELVAKLIENSLVRLKESRTNVDISGTKDEKDMNKLIDASLLKVKEERLRLEAGKTDADKVAADDQLDKHSNRDSMSSANSFSSANYEPYDFDTNDLSDCYQSCSSELTTDDDGNVTRSKFYQMLVDATLSEIEISTHHDDDHHYESIRLNGDPIYEEISDVPPPLPLCPPPNDVELDKKNAKSMFEGASKYDILSYLVDAKERGLVPEDSYTYNFSNTTDIIIEEESDKVSERLHTRQSSDISSRLSHLSNVSDMSGDETSLKSLVDRKTVADIERNDSGVGSETSKNSRSKYQSVSGSILNKNSPIHLCEDCDGPVETQITESGVMFAPLVCRKCGKKRAERKEIVTEIIETEEKYSRDLQIILEEFYQPMLVAGLLTQDQLSAIFLNSEELLENSQALAEKMRDAFDIAMEQGDDDLLTVNIGRLLLDAAPMLHAFESYCIRQAAASLLLANMEKEKELLRIFLRVSQMENTVLRRMNLNSFLMVPVQRVTKYPLLLARLFKVTPPHLDGRDLLKQAQEKIELHLNHMNREAKDVPTKLWRRISSSSPGRRSSCEIDMINIKLRKMAIDLLEWHHDEVRFAVEGKLLFTQPNDNNWRKGRTIKLTPVNALLVTNGKPSTTYKVDKALTEPLNFPRHTGIREATLLLVREKSGRYTLLREPLFLDRCIVCTEADWEDYFEVQEISSKDTFIFKAEDSARTKQWYTQLQYHSQGMGAWRKRRNALANIMINGMMMRS